MAWITSARIDEAAAVRAVAAPGVGALLTFAGTVRDLHLGREVVAIEYHAYESMAERELSRIEDEVRARWDGARVAIVHRIGLLHVGEVSVYIALSTPHRSPAFEALRFAIDTLKETVPIWKKEIYVDGYAWLEGS
ncbi:MAG TPA: molybdenum cofactor biosynthesis protein MoaE [Planctomycetota bacterium]|nr:molybdenum cofactor biosynthesis protein MoaE [Planctomycetota bacterium]